MDFAIAVIDVVRNTKLDSPEFSAFLKVLKPLNPSCPTKP
jgi:hypothetical protein